MSSNDMIAKTDFIFSCVLSPTISWIGFVLNLMCLIILFNSQFKQPNLYLHLRAEAIFICLNLLFSGLKFLYHCESTFTHGTYFSVLYFIYMINYFLSVLENSAFICRNISLYEFYLLVTNKKPSKYNFLLRLNYKLVAFIVFVFSFWLFFYQTFQFQVSPKIENNITLLNVYKHKLTEFSSSDLFRVNQIIAFSIRDFLNLFIMIFLNLLILKNILKSMKNKVDMQSKSTQNENAKNTIKSVKLMVIIGSLNYVIGRTPIAIYSILNTKLKYEELHFLIKFAVIIVNFSYTIHFILYITTNKLFRKIFIDYSKYVLNKFIK